MKKIKLGIVGAGFTSQTCHIPNFFKNKRVFIVALAEKRKLLRYKVAKKYKIKNIYEGHNQLLLNEKEIDGVIVVVRRNETFKVVKDCLLAGVNVFSEKPMTKTSNDAKILEDLSRKKKLVYKIGFNKIYDNGIILGKKIFDKYLVSRKFGKFLFFKYHRFSGTGYNKKIKYVKTKDPYPKTKFDPKNYPHFLNKKNFNVYDNYLNIYSHNINLILYFFKKMPEIKNVFTKKDYQLVVLNFKDFMGTLDTRFQKDLEWYEEMNFYFENGKIGIKTFPQQFKNKPAEISIKKRGKNEKKIKLKKFKWSFFNQSNSFINDLIIKKCVTNNARNCIRDLELVENIFKKYEKNNWK